MPGSRECLGRTCPAAEEFKLGTPTGLVKTECDLLFISVQHAESLCEARWLWPTLELYTRAE